MSCSAGSIIVFYQNRIYCSSFFDSQRWVSKLYLWFLIYHKKCVADESHHLNNRVLLVLVLLASYFCYFNQWISEENILIIIIESIFVGRIGTRLCAVFSVWTFVLLSIKLYIFGDSFTFMSIKRQCIEKRLSL